MSEKCKRCYHIQNGIAHKVFTSCARHKHKTYNQSNLLNSYLSKMPKIINTLDEYNTYQDDINYISRLNNFFINKIYSEVEIKYDKH